MDYRSNLLILLDYYCGLLVWKTGVQNVGFVSGGFPELGSQGFPKADHRDFHRVSHSPEAPHLGGPICEYPLPDKRRTLTIGSLMGSCWVGCLFFENFELCVAEFWLFKTDL